MPSKKVISFLILAVAFIVSIVIAFGKDKGTAIVSVATNITSGDKVSVPKNESWQEDLNSVGSYINKTDLASSSDTVANTLTDAVSQSLISNYLAMKQSGSLDNTSAQKLVDQAEQYINNTNTNKITETNLNIIADNGTKSIEDYGEALGRVLKNNRPTQNINELDILKSSITNKNETDIKKLDDVAKNYQKIATELIQIPVPKKFSKSHTDIVNGLKGMSASLKETEVVFKDPIKALVSLNSYQQSGLLLISATQATTAFIKNNKIIYKQGTGGYYLLYGI